ncbi:pyridoxamine 5'-phosphate oxidase, partial [Verrucomicrobiales bacterium]|nr:pyridoxamine 5'-phosphate oxidase [Verrucomicrobiales bacterium]
EFWGGYRLIPSSFEFWQGQPSRLHDRFSYEKADDTPNWSIRRLSP